ncbi:tyrosine--tRNA ligase [Lewinellaceae bacterium SD302]|nr:tyrosine--tRNA ligase [Lewinellaceae bacterium SD302]
MDFLQELEWRGMLHQQTPGLAELLAQGPQTAYIGFDPTAKSLTIGNYVQIMLLTLWQRAGNTPIVLMGGATGRIGDPSGKDQERQLKSYEELDGNLAAQVEQIKTMLDFEGENAAILVNNLDFYGEMSAIDFLRDVGKTLTINYMLAKDSVKNRIDTGMSFTEFSYQLLQGYDFANLHKDHGCKVQMGGSDQWGNITGGIEFVRRQQSEKVFAVTTPLLTKADGSKFGKSEAGNIWMGADYTSPYEFYQFWLRGDDADLEKFIKYFSLRPRVEMEDMIARIDDNPQSVKRELAEELTERIHGERGLKIAKNVTNILYGRGATPEDLAELDAPTLLSLDGKIDTFRVPLASFVAGSPIIDFLADDTEALASKSEAKRAIKGNAISINKEKITSEEKSVTTGDLLHDKFLLLENGKKRKYLVIAE